MMACTEHYNGWLDGAVRGPVYCTSVVVLAATLIMCVCGFIGWRCLSRRVQPPGPRALPLLGHLPILGALPHQTMARLSKRYGALMSLRFGSLPVIIASSPAMAKLILHTHDKIFAGRPQNLTILTNAFQGCSLDIAFSLPGPYWKLMRQLCFTEIFSAKRLEYFQPVRTAEVHSLMLSIVAAQGTPLSIREMLLSSNSNLISRMAVGATLQELVAGIPNSNKVMSAVLELFHLVGVFNLGDYVPSLAWMDLQGYDRRSKEAASMVSSVFQAVIDRRRSIHSGIDPPQDFLDVLLSASLNAKHTPIPIGDANIRAVLLDMFSAGVDTAAVTTEWALSELLANPRNLKLVQEELEQIVGCSRFVEESDLPNLPYLCAVVYETLRLHPPAPLLLPHVSMEPCQISNYPIPKGTAAYVNVWAIHRDANSWDNPLDFCPERFLDSNIDALGQECKFLPFGAGRRSCPGSKLGLLNVQIVLANLVHAFDWQTLGKPHMQHEKFGLVVALQQPLTVVPMPKLPRALFETLM